MKKVFNSMLLLMGMLSMELHAQFVTVNDTAFVRYLTDTYPACMSGNQMDTTCADIINATQLQIYDNNARWGAYLVDITEIKYFKNLERFHLFTAPYFQVLPPLPATVTEIVVDSTGLNSVLSLPPNLTYLWFENNAALTSVPSLPATLNYLNVVNTNIGSLPALPANLDILLFGGFPWLAAPISSMPLLPAGLKELTVFNTNITNISTLPSTLEHLDVTSNNLGSLPNLPSTLTYLSCSDANLTALPALPNGLTLLNCSNNNISFLPNLPNSLQRLWCEFNNLTSLPSMPASLDYLYCRNNSITSLPSLPNKLTQMIISNNPISCLPDIDTISVLYFQNTDITCRSNANLRVFGSVPSYGALPVCDVYDSNYCGQFANISGRLYLDGNANCTYDSWETKLSDIHVRLLQNGQVVQQTTTNGVGYYGFALQAPNGPYQVEIDPTLLSYAVACGPGSTQTVSLSAGNPAATSVNFGLSCNGAFDVGVQSIVPPTGWFRPTSVQTVDILAGDLSNLTGSSCAAGQSGEVKVVMRGAASNLSAVGALSPTSVSGDTITWNISDFATVNLQSSFIVSFRIDTFATFNDSVCFDVYVSSTNTDAEPANDQLSICIQVQTSYDPNDKLVSPLSDIDTTQEWLHYTIRFQNTGTAPAQHVKITDQLSTHLDHSTFQVLSASHDHVTNVSYAGVATFNFPYIELPDSNFDEPNSHGYVNYKIKLKENLPIGTSIENTAYIYFDYNPAIVTNTTVNTIVNPLATPVVTASATTACVNDSIKLSTPFNAAYTYEWFKDGFAIPASNTDTLWVTATGDYKVVIDDGGAVVESNELTLTFDPLPIVSLSAPVNDICEHEAAITLTPSPIGGTYSGAVMSGDDFDPAANILGQNTVTYLYTDNNSCSASATADITVNAKPTAALTAASASVCEGAPAVSLTPSPSGGTYGGATISANEFDPAANSLGLNTIEYFYTDGNGCADTATVDITVNAKPTATLATASTAVCEYAPAVSLTPSPSGGTFGGATISANEFDPAANSLGLNTIEYFYTDGNGCADTATVDITVNEKPTATLVTASTAVCEYAPAVSLTPSPSGGTYGGATISANEFDPAANSLGLNTIEYFYTDGNGCADTARVDITVNAKPTAALTAASASVCEYAPAVTLTPSPSGGTYGGATISANEFDPAANSLGLNTIEYFYTDGNGCADTATVDITVNAKPTVTLTTPTASICEYEPAVTLTPSPSGGVYTGATITNNEFDPAVNNPGYNRINYYYTDGNGCIDTAQVVIRNNPKPTATLSLSETEACEDTYISVSASPSGGIFGGDWSTSGIFDFGRGNNPGQHTIDYYFTDSFGCADSATVSITVHPDPVVSFSLPTDTYCLGSDPVSLGSFGSPQGGNFSGHWVKNNVFTPGFVDTIDIIYTYEDNNGCRGSAGTRVYVEACSGIDEAEAVAVRIYPNPASNAIILQYTGNQKLHTAKLYDLSGKQVAIGTATPQGANIDVADLPAANYLLLVHNSDNTIIARSKITVVH